MTHDLWTTLNFKMFEYLSSVTLAELVDQQLQEVRAATWRPASGCAASGGSRAPARQGNRPSVADRNWESHVCARLSRPQRHDAADPAVLEAMLPWLSEQFGNASSRHEYGRAARRAIDEARSKVAAAVGAHATEVVFTSGGSEANNLFIKGAAACLKPGLLAVSAIEHPCVIRPAEQLGQAWLDLAQAGGRCAGRVDAAGKFPGVMAQQAEASFR
jgi:hypothetical protein